MLLLASGSLIAPVFASILRSVETRVSNLLVDLLTTRSLLSFHLPGLAHTILESGAGSSTCFLLFKDGLGVLTRPFQPTQVSSVFLRLPAHRSPHPLLSPTPPYFCGRGPEDEINTLSGDRSPQTATCFGERQTDSADPPASQSLGRRAASLWISWGVRPRPGKMLLGTDSPTSSRAARVGPRFLFFF